MRAWNLCPSTWVLDRRYSNMPGVEYKTFSWTDDDGNPCESTFVQSRKGVVPGMLEELAKMRKVRVQNIAHIYNRLYCWVSVPVVWH